MADKIRTIIKRKTITGLTNVSGDINIEASAVENAIVCISCPSHAFSYVFLLNARAANVINWYARVMMPDGSALSNTMVELDIWYY